MKNLLLIPDISRPQSFVKATFAYDSYFMSFQKEVLVAMIQIINGFRHYLVSYLRDNGSHIHFIQEIVGHQGSKTTEIYMPLSKKLLPNISSLKCMIIENQSYGN
jgi:integrase